MVRLPRSGSTMRARLRALLCTLPILLVALSLAACVKKPTMSLSGAELTTISTQGLSMKIYMAVKNENGFDIQVRNVRASTVLQGRVQQFALPPIDYSPQVWLPAKQTSPVWVPVIIPWQAVFALAFETPFTPSVPYTVQGFADVTATSTAKLDKDAVQFTEQGVLSRQALLDIALRNPTMPH